MLGINEEQCCELLEHQVYDEDMPKVHPWRLLPYVKEQYDQGDFPMQFATIEETKAYAEQRIREWVEMQHQEER
jgi:hypothetical protein